MNSGSVTSQTTSPQWDTRYQLDIPVVGHHWPKVAFGGGPPVAHHYAAVGDIDV